MVYLRGNMRKSCFHLSVRDRVEWDDEQERHAEEAVKLNSTVLLPDDKIGTYRGHNLNRVIII